MDPPLPPYCAVTTNCAVPLSHRAWFWFASVAHRSGADLSTRCDVILGSKLVCKKKTKTVQGGGIEKEAFYDACDRHGIMVYELAWAYGLKS